MSLMKLILWLYPNLTSGVRFDMARLVMKLFAIGLLATSIAFSVIQLRIPVAKAASCPDAATVGCGCTFTYSVEVIGEGRTGIECHYSCYCQTAGGEPMYIEQTVTVWD